MPGSSCARLSGRPRLKVGRGPARRSAREQNMRGGSKLFIIAGVGLGLVAVLLLVISMGGGGGQTDAQNSSKGGKVTVVQSTRDIPAHNIIQLEDLVEKQVNGDTVPADAVHSVSEVVGKSYRIPLA